MSFTVMFFKPTQHSRHLLEISRYNAWVNYFGRKTGITRGLLWLSVILTLPVCTNAGELHIAVASNFASTMGRLVTAFEQTSPHRVTLSYGSSGKLYAQIRHGAPYHAFFSADQTKPQALEATGYTLAGSRFTYALGTLVLYSSNPKHPDTVRMRLEKGDFNKLTLANPRLAPYGSAAVEVLNKLKLVEITRSKWVQGENIGQTYQFVHSGAVDLGFIALSQLGRGQAHPSSAWIPPEDLYNPIRQDAVLLKNADENPAAQAFWEFAKGSHAQDIILGAGYRLSSAP